MEYKPPFTANENIINALAEISELVGKISVLHKEALNPKLRRENRIKTIHSSLAIEQNTLSAEQVTAIIDGKRVLGPPKEIREVQNAYETYELMLSLDPLSIYDLLKAHKIIQNFLHTQKRLRRRTSFRFQTNGLVRESGCFRSGGVGIFDGQKLIHAAPPANYVPELILNLFEWYRNSNLHILIKNCVFHYEFEFIHPFSDGNGRMGRMWHTLLLSKWNKLFAWLPIEDLIRKNHQEYYDALAEADRKADSACFVEMMMNIIHLTLADFYKTVCPTDNIQKSPALSKDNIKATQPKNT
ncbi:MAG: Fic family protein [Clostridiales bacterium]|nr:Fic family protein [Clostridiales bacterium]